jgi:hypothetical protein
VGGAGVCGTAECPDHGEAEVTGAGKERRRRWRSSGDAGLGLGYRGVWAATCRAAAVPLTCGPEARKLAGDLGEGGCAGEEGEKEKGTLTRGADRAEREKRRARRAWAGERGRAGVRPTRGKRGKRGERWASDGFGPWEEREGERARGWGRGERFGQAGLGSFPFLFSFPTQLIQTNLIDFKRI